jgi:hypothetical protein
LRILTKEGLSMSVFKVGFRAFPVLLALGASAHAAVISDTLDGSAGDTTKSLSSKAAGESFTADGSGNLGDLELNLAGTSASGSVVITLNANSGGTPGAVLQTIATVAASSIPAAETLYDFYNLPVTGLTSGDTYWIKVAKTATPTGIDAFTTATAATTGSGQIYWPGATPTSTALFLTDCVSSDNACDAANTPSAGYSFNQGAATPEPSSVAILGAGLLGLGYFGRRRVRLAKA